MGSVTCLVCMASICQGHEHAVLASGLRDCCWVGSVRLSLHAVMLEPQAGPGAGMLPSWGLNKSCSVRFGAGCGGEAALVLALSLGQPDIGAGAQGAGTQGPPAALGPGQEQLPGCPQVQDLWPAAPPAPVWGAATSWPPPWERQWQPAAWQREWRWHVRDAHEYGKAGDSCSKVASLFHCRVPDTV